MEETIKLALRVFAKSNHVRAAERAEAALLWLDGLAASSAAEYPNNEAGGEHGMTASSEEGEIQPGFYKALKELDEVIELVAQARAEAIRTGQPVYVAVQASPEPLRYQYAVQTRAGADDPWDTWDAYWEITEDPAELINWASGAPERRVVRRVASWQPTDIEPPK